MRVDFKKLLEVNPKWLFLLGGIILGLISGVTLMSFNQKFNLVELDLKKIIHTYSVNSSKSTKSMDEIQKEFKIKFNSAINKIPNKTIVVTKGGLLSKHPVIDYTNAFMEIMRIDKTNE